MSRIIEGSLEILRPIEGASMVLHDEDSSDDEDDASSTPPPASGAPENLNVNDSFAETDKASGSDEDEDESVIAERGKRATITREEQSGSQRYNYYENIESNMVTVEFHTAMKQME